MPLWNSCAPRSHNQIHLQFFVKQKGGTSSWCTKFLHSIFAGGRFPFYLRILRKVSIFWKCSFLSQLVILSFYSIYRERPIFYWETPQLQMLHGQSFQVPIEPRSSCKQYKYLCDIFSNPPIESYTTIYKPQDSSNIPFLLDSFHLQRSATSGNPNVNFRGCNHFNQHLTRLLRLLQVTSLRGGASASSCPTPAITRGRTAYVARDDFLEGRKMRDARTFVRKCWFKTSVWRRLTNWLEDCCNVGCLTTIFQGGRLIIAKTWYELFNLGNFSRNTMLFGMFLLFAVLLNGNSAFKSPKQRWIPDMVVGQSAA